MLNKFNILLITPSLKIGGEEMSTLSITKELKKRAHNVWVMTTDGPLFPKYKKNEIKVIFANVDKRNPMGFISGVKDIRGFIAQNDIQIIHSQSVVPTVMAYFASRSLRRKEPKVIWHCRGIKKTSYPLVAKCFNFMTDFVIANSRFEMNRLIKNGLSQNHVKVIHNCLNIEFPAGVKRSGNNHPIVGTVSRLTPQKGLKFFLEAAKKISQELPEVRFLIVGDGSLKRDLEQLALSLKIKNIIEFIGFKQEMGEIYPLIDILVLPSLWEPFGNVAIEAEAYGIPVVASNVGGIPEAVIDRETGILVPPGDAKRLAEAILFFLHNPKIAQRMGQAGRERVKDYFMREKMLIEVEKIYKHVLSKK